MDKTINATDAVREFSEILNSVKYRGSRFTVLRGGKPTAAIVPVESTAPGKTFRELEIVVKSLPALGDDRENFACDIEEIIHTQPPVSEGGTWE